MGSKPNGTKDVRIESIGCKNQMAVRPGLNDRSKTELFTERFDLPMSIPEP